MPSRDTLDKVFGTYLASVCDQPFSYGNQRYEPVSLRISPLLFRGYTCPAACGGCCGRFSLDYLPSESVPSARLTERWVTVNGKNHRVLSDKQEDHASRFCRHLASSGRCDIYAVRPFACDFELIRFTRRADAVHMCQKLFGRGWAMARVDGGRGALCEIVRRDDTTVPELVRKLTRLSQWADYFRVSTRLEEIIAWVESGPHSDALWLRS